jgi:hypothetical protein
MTLFIRIPGSKLQFKEDLTVVEAPLNGEIGLPLVKVTCLRITFYNYTQPTNHDQKESEQLR